MKTSFSYLPLPWVAVLALLPVACSPHHETPEAEQLPTATVRTVKVRSGTHVDYQEAVGTVRAKFHASLAAKVSGRIAVMRAVAGQRVASGDVLAELAADEIQAKLDQASAGLEQADNDLRRFQSLLDQEAATQAEFDAVKARQQIAAAAVEEARTMRSYTRVTAPFDGVITRKLAEAGDLATPGLPLIQMENAKELQFEASVPGDLIDKLRVGTQTQVQVSGLGEPINGTVVEMAPSADPVSRTFAVKLDLDSASGARAGQFGRVNIAVERDPSLWIPAAALLQRGQMQIVFVVSDNQAHLRLVRSGRKVGQEIEIVSGLSGGEVITTTGTAALIDGQPIQVQP